MSKLNKPVIIDMYDSGIDFLDRTTKEGIQSELGAINKKPSKEELYFRLKELYTIGNVIANVVKTLIELQYLVDTQKPKNYQALKTRIKKYDLGTIARAYDMWASTVTNLLSLYEIDEGEGLIFSKENLTNKFTDNDLYKINKTLTRDMGAEEVFAELGKRQPVLHDIIVDLENSAVSLPSDNDILQKYMEQGQINATLDLSDTYPVVKITDTDDSYTLNNWVSQSSDPYKIISWCIKNSNDSFVQNSRIKRELSLNRGINETLRKSLFNPDGILGAFVSTDEKRKRTKVRTKAKLTSKQLEDIKAVSS